MQAGDYPQVRAFVETFRWNVSPSSQIYTNGMNKIRVDSWIVLQKIRG